MQNGKKPKEEPMKREDLRNIAIIAHVDHGKTTLVDEMLKQGGTFRDNQVVQDRVMDSGDLERERGITILAKNTSTTYQGVKINIVDTPGHADFGGEVERVLKMVNGVLLLVDAAEGPMPQTRFVLEKALAQGLRVVIIVNKIDKPDARIKEVVDEVLELFIDLGASDEQLDSPTVFCSGRQGTASYSPDVPGTDLVPLFDTIVNYVAPPEGEESLPLSVLVSSVEYSSFVGRIAVGRVETGSIRVNQEVTVCDYHDPEVKGKGKITAVYQYDGLAKTQVQEARVGDIVAFSGIEDITIGNTVCDPTRVEPIPFVKISEPTMEMTFSVNDSPFCGKEGKWVTSRQIRDRLYRELLKDVSLHVEDTESADSFRVLGRGEMHLSILIETMRREGYEFQVGAPKVLYKEIGGKRCEPIEELVVDVPEEYMGSVMEKMGYRKGELQAMQPKGSRMELRFLVPARGLFGYRSEFLTDTRGEGIMSSVFHSYEEFKGEISGRQVGSLVAFETGEAVAYGIFNAQERGMMFIDPGEKVYAGMVVGSNPKGEDMTVNVCKKKHMSNTRASGSDDALRLIPPRHMSLEESLEFLAADELLEVTPKNIRIRKKILDHSDRMKATAKKKSGRPDGR
jgi:GTP-binding protein